MPPASSSNVCPPTAGTDAAERCLGHGSGDRPDGPRRCARRIAPGVGLLVAPLRREGCRRRRSRGNAGVAASPRCVRCRRVSLGPVRVAVGSLRSGRRGRRSRGKRARRRAAPIPLQPSPTFRENVRRLGQGVRVHVHGHLIPVARRSPVEPARQRALRDHPQRIRLPLRQRRPRGAGEGVSVRFRHRRVGAAGLVANRLERPPHDRAHLRRQTAPHDQHPVLVHPCPQRPRLVPSPVLGLLGQAVHPPPGRHDLLHVGRRARQRHVQQIVLGLGRRHPGERPAPQARQAARRRQRPRAGIRSAGSQRLSRKRRWWSRRSSSARRSEVVDVRIPLMLTATTDLSAISHGPNTAQGSFADRF